MIYTNTTRHGHNFLDVLDREFKHAKDVNIASGYTSLDILSRYKDDFIRIAKEGGESKLLVGMAFYEGLSQKKLDLLLELSNDLQNINEKNGVYVSYQRKFHGKIFKFNSTQSKNIYIGSSNFSRSGLSENIEATIPVKDKIQASSVDEFLNFMYNPEVSTFIEKAEIIVPGSKKFKKKISVSSLSDLQKYDTKTINLALLHYFDFSLARVASSEKSSLNVYFGKGRWTRSTGKVVARNWYEIELIAPKELTSLPVYPKGDFTAYTDDGYVMPMKTSSASSYFKNIRSRGNLKILGMWIKKKLQDSGALVPLTPVTQDTLDAYGQDHIRFFHIEGDKYFMKF